MSLKYEPAVCCYGLQEGLSVETFANDDAWPTMTLFAPNNEAWVNVHIFCLRIRVYVVIYDAGKVSLEHLLLWRHTSQRGSGERAMRAGGPPYLFFLLYFSQAWNE